MRGESAAKLARLGRIKIHSNCNFSSAREKTESLTSTLQRLGGKTPCVEPERAGPRLVTMEKVRIANQNARSGFDL